MQQAIKEIHYLVGDEEVLSHIERVPALPLFSQSAIAFLDSLSHKLMHDDAARRYPDVIAFAFWIRKEYQEKVADRYRSPVQRIGKGVVFHITPSNIPVQFAVSMTYALVSGNASIIRVSNKQFEQVDIICNAISDVINSDHPEFKPYLCVVRYDHSDAITQDLSYMCDVRMIWGGNRTIAEVRKAGLRPRSLDLGFADRFSFTVIDADSYLKNDASMLAVDFYNDTYFSDQNACSSPRLVVWLGDCVSEARERFWSALEKVVSARYTMDPICSSEKLLKTAVCAARYPGIREVRNENTLVRIKLPKLFDDIMEAKGNCGYFFEYHAEKLEEIVPLLMQECQTVSYIGDLEQELGRLIGETGVRGVDRIVPVGHASDIVYVWDGIDIPNALSRIVGRT